MAVSASTHLHNRNRNCRYSDTHPNPGRYALCLTAKLMRYALTWTRPLLSRPVVIYLRSFIVVALAGTLHSSEPLRLVMTGTGFDLGPGSVRGVASDGTNFITATRAPDGHIRRL